MTSLDGLSHPNAITWVKEFERTARHCNWEDTAGLATLRAAAGPEILDIIESRKMLSTAIKAIIEALYPRRDRMVYLRRIESLKQEDFRTIQQCADELERLFSE